MEGDRAEADIEVVKPLLIKLAALLLDDDLEATDVLEDIKGHLKHTDLMEGLLRIEKYLGRYDFDGALEALKDMTRRMDLELEEGHGN